MNYLDLNTPMKRPKEQLGQLIREVGEVFTVATAAKVLDSSNTETAKTLARWAKQGWLTRIKRGLYAVVPLEASSTDRMLEDAWLLIPDLFDPCYIGGWSAAEYWDLTEQIFRSICIITDQPQTKKFQTLHNIDFVLTKVKPILMFGTKTVWKQHKKIQVSDPHKTILDILYDPQLGGGITHVVDCFNEYNKNKQCNYTKLIEYAVKINNGAVFKRLGFIAERFLGNNHEVTVACKEHLTQGNAYFDPKLKKGKLITRWRLIIPTSFKELI